MLKTRLIPVLLLKNGRLVRSEGFRTHQIIGDPYHEVQRFNEWNVDELVYLDISCGGACDGGRRNTRSRDEACDVGRRDTRSRNGACDSGRPGNRDRDLTGPLAILAEVARTCFMPLTWGGRIRSLADIRARVATGADKVTLCTAAVRTPELITAGAQIFGSQAMVVGIDARRHADGRTEAYINAGSEPTGLTPAELARRVVDAGAGEILLQSIDRDGMGEGYDEELIAEVAGAVNIPVITLGGVGAYEHYAAGVRAGAAAVAAANIWHFKELSDRGGKRALQHAGVPVRNSGKG